jgi:prophage DNA circulation protein
MNFDPSLPKPQSEDWRENYGFRYDEKGRRYRQTQEPLLSTYQPPGGKPVPFVFDGIRLSGGQSVDTAEYPFFGFWSNTPLNEKPQAVTVNGFIRGDFYIKNRNAIVEALRVKTSDDDPGFIHLPLWGRFPVVVSSYEVEEKGRQNGQCSVSITLTRAGVTAEERWKFEGKIEGRAALARGDVADAAIEKFNKDLKDNADPGTLAGAFGGFKGFLIGIIGRVRGAASALNVMTNEAAGISNLIAQGIRAPRDLAQAVFSAADSIAAGIYEIANSASDTAAYFAARDNTRNALINFLSGGGYRLDVEAVTARQMTTKTASENLYRTVSLCAAGQLLTQLENPSYQQIANYWALYEKLEAGVDQSDPAVYRAIQNMRIAVSGELAARNFDMEQARRISAPAPLLYLAHYLGCDNKKLRTLNRPEDSFVMRGDILYV